MKSYSGITLLLVCGMLINAARAAENMAFFGTLVEPPACTINNGKDVDVDFGSRVGIKKVDGVNYLQPMNYVITCDPNANAWAMTLEIVGVPADYDRAAVVTGVKDLAVQIKQNGIPFELNKPLPILLTHPPLLEAVPVKRPGATLTEGPFEATATLKAVYQ